MEESPLVSEPHDADSMDEVDARPDRSSIRKSLPVHSGAYFSEALGREQRFVYLLPEGVTQENSAEAGLQFPLFVCLHGWQGHCEDWPTYTRLTRYAAAYRMVIAFPEGGNGWYTNAFDGSARYEDDLVQDFLPFVQNNLPVTVPGKQWAIGGLSMGGYGAVKIALKYPHLFSVALSHSGALERTTASDVHPVFGDPVADARFRLKENPFYLVEQAMCRWPTERPRLYLDCGESDVLLEANRRFKDHLTFIGYPHTYVERPGHHTWPYWNRSLREVLPGVAHDLGMEMR